MGDLKCTLNVPYQVQMLVFGSQLLLTTGLRNLVISRVRKPFAKSAKVFSLIRNEQVTGSSPATSSIGKSRPPGVRGLFLCLDIRGPQGHEKRPQSASVAD